MIRTVQWFDYEKVKNCIFHLDEYDSNVQRDICNNGFTEIVSITIWVNKNITEFQKNLNNFFHVIW